MESDIGEIHWKYLSDKLFKPYSNDTPLNTDTNPYDTNPVARRAANLHQTNKRKTLMPTETQA